MRLLRIQAERFGNIDGRALGDLSPSLTVVHGPNEAGKSSFTALVRHVLYGFPTPASEGAYLSASGKRLGRLVFSDGSGEWVVERSEGPHGGPVSVRALTGASRDRLADDLTSGVSANAYKVVFGFGLSEMDQIAAGAKGREDHVLAQLYAASAGLGVNLLDVRSGLETEIADLWKPGGSNPTLNKAKAERERIRTELRTLQAEAETLRAEVSRLDAAESELEVARTRRLETKTAAERVERAITDVERLLAEAAENVRAAEQAEADAVEARRQSSGAAPDAAALAAADTIDALAEELSGYREQLSAIASDESRLAGVDARVREAVGDSGWTETQALAASSDAGVGAQIESARDRLSAARARLDMAVATIQSSGGVQPAPVSQPIGSPWRIPGIAIALVGALAAAVGFIRPDLVPALGAVGLFMLVSGLVLAVAGPRSGAAQVSSSAGLVSQNEHAAAATAWDEARAVWSEWVIARGLGDGSEDAAAIAARYQAARSVRVAVDDRSTIVARIAETRAVADAFAARVAAQAAPVIGEDPSSITPDRVAEVVSRARARVMSAREAHATCAESLARAESADRDASTARTRALDAQSGVAALLEQIGATEGGLERARELRIETADAAEQASEAFDAISQEAAALRARLGVERRDDALAELRLTEATIGERIAAGMESYAVLSMASHLLTLAKERYERDRQPEVMLRAGAALATITNGRYDRIASALDSDAIEVFDAASGAHAPRLLSRGTAEQVYLALRIGLIDQLGDVGAGLPVLMDDVLVNFSPERAEPAARAIAELATRRQVVFFTCHPGQADLLCSVAPDAVRLDIEPGRP